MNDQFKASLIKNLEKARDSVVGLNIQKQADRYQSWIDQINTGKITDPDLWIWLENLINYYGEKDRPYAAWLQKLIEESI